MKRSRVVMVYPQQGFSGTYVRHIPLSLLYASTEIVKAGYDVQILDTRVNSNWQAALRELINDDTLCVGISVMSGYPIKHAIAIGRAVKELARHVPVVWGGPHATFYADSILNDEWSADYVVSGYASQSFFHLCEALRADQIPSAVAGVSWRDGTTVRRTEPENKKFEFVDYKDIPYHLISDYSVYGQLDQDRRIFSMYSAMGCPYRCTFCSSPAQYSTIEGKRWVPLSATDVANHVEFLVKNYQANYIYFIDDDSFPSLKHVSDIIAEIKARHLPVKLGFRGARINEIKRMDDAFLSELASVGTDIMHIGAESGSDRILKLLKKDSSYEDIVECNRKLARHPEITAAYNFIMGVPGETLDDLKRTRDLMMQLVKDHPNCIIFPPNKFRPLPGTELYDMAQRDFGYSMPSTLEAWANIEVEGDISDQWYEKGMKSFCNLLLITSYFVDNKAEKFTTGKTLFYKFVRLINHLYGPIARFRLKHGLASLLIEYHLYRVMVRLLARLQSLTRKHAPEA